MVHLRLSLAALALALVASCTKENAAFCCLTEADCAANGVDELRTCTDGLACVGNTCVAPTCTTNGCGVEAPVCEIATDQCVGCTDSSQCATFATTPVCDTASGGCVQCVDDGACSGSAPVCDDNMCRACRLDSECPSAACNEDGACVPEANVVYLDPQGTDALPCSRAQPCKSLSFGLAQTNDPRSHLVLNTGVYLDTRGVVSFSDSSATTIILHGGNSTLSSTSDDGFLSINQPAAIRDVEIANSEGVALSLTATTLLERVRVRGEAGIYTYGSTTLRDVDFEVQGCAIALRGGSLTIDRARVSGGTKGICAVDPTFVTITNLLVEGTSELGVDLSGAIGSMSFTTIADTGTSASGPSGMKCTQQNLSVSASIIWAPNVARPTVEGGCTVTNSIVGPMSFGTAMNVYPGFVSSTQHDYHLSGGSPARDQVNAGPEFDFEREPRPQGVRFDLGADEAP
jgi:hypothetical protein